MELDDLSFEKTLRLYKKFFSLNYLNSNLEDKLACIALTCYLTNLIKKKNQNITCYDVLLKICKDFSEVNKNTFLKSLGAICEDIMYGCDTFPDFGIKPKEMPLQLRTLLQNYVPF